MLLTWPSFNNIRMLLMACMPVVIFYMIWLINTSEGIRSEEGTLLDLVCWPDGNVIPIIVAFGASVAVVIELFGLYQLFKAGLSKSEYNVTNGLFYYIWALIIMVVIFFAIIFYSGLQSTIIRAKIKGGIMKAMLRYSTHLPSKVAIDRLQTRFHCCGRDDYREWFYIPWYTSGNSVDISHFVLSSNSTQEKITPLEHHKKPIIKVPLVVKKPNNEGGRKFVADSVPYSCCSIDALCPCVHHRITKKGIIYKYDPAKMMTIYKDGCEEKLINEMMAVSWRFNCVMALIIVAMILQAIAVRYLHTAYRNGLHLGNQIESNAYLIRSCSVTDTEDPRVAGPSGRSRLRQSLNRRRVVRQTRTLEWVAGSYRRRQLPSTSTSESSSEEFLKPIDE